MGVCDRDNPDGLIANDVGDVMWERLQASPAPVLGPGNGRSSTTADRRIAQRSMRYPEAHCRRRMRNFQFHAGKQQPGT
jgi:hypothetical protein